MNDRLLLLKLIDKRALAMCGSRFVRDYLERKIAESFAKDHAGPAPQTAIGPDRSRQRPH